MSPGPNESRLQAHDIDTLTSLTGQRVVAAMVPAVPVVETVIAADMPECFREVLKTLTTLNRFQNTDTAGTRWKLSTMRR